MRSALSQQMSTRLSETKSTNRQRLIGSGHTITIEPGHEKICLMSYANNKGADQTAHPRNLICAFVVRCLDSLIALDSIAEISRL